MRIDSAEQGRVAGRPSGARHSGVVLVADHDPLTCAMAEAMLRSEGYTVETAADGPAALHKARQVRLDLVLLDVAVPELDAFSVCERLRQMSETADVPILVMAGLDDQASRIRSLECGADDLLTKPIDPPEMCARVRTILRLNGFRRAAALTGELVSAYDATLESWVRALDLRDHEPEGHTERVTMMAVAVAEAMGVPAQELEHVRRGALLHDIGKIGMPDAILHKPGPLDPWERTIIEQHPILAHQMLSPISWLHRAIDIPYGHHERWDGTGYPRGIAGTRIPVTARVFAVVDVWDALRSDRTYKRAFSRESARSILRRHAGTQFDPTVADLFLKLEDEGLLEPWSSGVQAAAGSAGTVRMHGEAAPLPEKAAS